MHLFTQHFNQYKVLQLHKTLRHSMGERYEPIQTTPKDTTQILVHLVTILQVL